MIFNSFLLGNLLSLCMKIINSVVVVGLYYGFLTTFSIGPSYLFLLRARVMEEGTEKEVSATTGFITGQLMMFISIYYAPLHLALDRPHTITVLVLPYLLFHFFWNNHKHFFDYGSTTRNSMRNLSIQFVFLNNLIFQLLNHFILPSPTLARLVNIYMFRCNNKMLFVTSSFVGWLIGHILFMKWVGLVLFWIRQNRSIRSNKYLVPELRNSMARIRIFSILLFITCVYYLGRIPSPIVTKKLKETLKTEERGESEEETDVEIETTSETKGTKQEQGGSTEEAPSPSFCSEERNDHDPDKIDETEEIRVNGKEKINIDKNSPVYDYENDSIDSQNLKLEREDFDEKFWFEKPLVTLLFDYQRWNRPLRYLKNDRFENAVRNEMSQYFFYTCLSNGKKNISFTYPPSLSTFFEMIQKKLFLHTMEKISSEELYNRWVYTNEQKKNNLSDEFLNRIEALDKGSLDLDVLEKKTRLCNDETEQNCLPKVYDPFLNGPRRETIKNFYSGSSSSMNNFLSNSLDDSIIWINKLHGILVANDCREFYHKHKSEFTGEPTSNFNLKGLSSFSEQGKFRSENQLKNLLDVVPTYPNDETTLRESIGINEIKKKVTQWSYKLTDDLEEEEIGNEEESRPDRGIRSRKAKRVVIFTDNETNKEKETSTTETPGTTKNKNTENTSNQDRSDEVALTRYSQQSDFRRDLIKGSMRAQRRKTVTWELFQATVHSPLFLDRVDKTFFFPFDISGTLSLFFRHWGDKGTEFKISNSEETKEQEKKKEAKRQENERIRIAETWDTIIFAQGIRGYMLVTQSILRKYLVLPSLIIVKNVGRMLLFQFPEWREDLKAWSKEMHVKCTYNGVQLSEKEFPKNWLTDGIQIKILFPFCLKPWHKSKIQSDHRDPVKNKGKTENFCFLTVWGLEAELPFGSPRKRPSFFEPIGEEIEKKLLKIQKKCFLALRILKQRTKWFIRVSKQKTRWIFKIFRFIKKIMQEFAKVSPIPLFGLREINESSINRNRQNYTISNKIIQESPSQIRSGDWINYSLTAKKIKDLADRTSTIRDQIKKITKDKKKIFITPELNISPNETSCDDKKLESQQGIWRIFKRRSTRLIRKWHYFLKFFIEKIYIDILLCIINSLRINRKLFLESKKKIFYKYSSNNETNQEGIDETNPKTIHFISTIKKALSTISKKNSPIFCDLASLSQAYVFYKLSQTQVINKYYLRSVLQYHGTILFIKDKIKDSFGTQRLSHFHLESGHKKIRNFRLNEWKNWLRGPSHYHYDLSKTRWSRLVPQKWRNRTQKSCIGQTKNSTNFDLYEKDQIIHYEKQNNYAVESLLNKKDKLKNYKYDCLSHKYIHYEDKKGSYIYRSLLQVNEAKKFLSNYNTYNPNFFYVSGDISLNNVSGDISLNNYLREDCDTRRNPDRKYFDWKIFYFCLRTKIDIEYWANINKNTKTRTNYYQIIDNIDNKDKKDLFYPAIHKQVNPANQTKTSFDWMEMNEEILNCPISNLELWFFPEFVSLYDAYKIQPWTIPINLLLLNFNGNENVSEKKKINEKQKKDPELENKKKKINEKQKKDPELENKTKEEKKEEKNKPVQGNIGSDPSNQQKNVKQSVKEDSDGGSNIQSKNKKKSTKDIAAELDFFLKRYFLFQLRWDNPLNKKILNNVKVYCLLLRLKNPREIAIASIQRNEMSLDVMPISKTLTLAKLLKRGILIIEPARLSIKWDGQFIMYQTIAISRVHKNKHQTKTNQKCQEKINVDKTGLDKFITQHERLVGNRNKNHNDLLVVENILSPKRRRELRIRICLSLNSGRNVNIVNTNTVFCKGNKASNCVQFLDEGKHLDRNTNQFIKLKLFLWPNYRLEDLACMNRYWFDTNNGSRFSLSRIRMYPRLRIS
uniref:Protein TIC 214 n=1 Tax=Sinopodophyllum hexandrum TaxID=93608 RepID=A0A0K1HPF7_SINHE|nr:hypothetical chloroplast RF1 [Sinopodophyllum hexandrum]AKT94042.1 hypothetical chloroplast RF1 [Sinopodophyllum hexandrum]